MENKDLQQQSRTQNTTIHDINSKMPIGKNLNLASLTE